MSTMFVVGYDDKYQATEVLHSLQRMEQDHLVDLNDAVAVARQENGRITYNQNIDYEGEGIGWGMLWGTMLGSMLALPFTAGTSAAAGASILLSGGVAGGALGAAGGAIDGDTIQREIGLDPEFAGEVADTLKPGTSAVMALVSTGAPDKVADELGKHGGRLLQTSLTEEQDGKFRMILAGSE